MFCKIIIDLEKVKIALVRQKYTPYGGAERFVERALSALMQQGVDASLITRSWDGAEGGSSTLQKLTPIICNPSWSRWAGRSGRDRSFAREAQKLFDQFDLVQSHERIPGCDLFRAGDGVHRAWMRHREATLSRLGRYAQYYSPFHSQLLRSEAELVASPKLRGIICNSHMVADEWRQYYAVPDERLHVIYNGVDTEKFHPRLRTPEARIALRERLGWSLNDPVFLFVGSGFQRKGVPQLLEALARTQGFRLCVVGADRKLEAMRRKAEELGLSSRVAFAGPQVDVLPFYAAADAFVLPTLYDPCPNAVLEAMACGLPVLVSPTCGAREWVLSGENGLISDPLNCPLLSRDLSDLVEVSRQEISGERAREAVQGLTLEAMSQRLVELYRTLTVK